MKTLSLVSVAILLATSAIAGDGLKQSPASKSFEIEKLARYLKGRTLICANKKGQETFILATKEKAGKTELATKSSYGDASIEVEGAEIVQLQAGDLLIFYVTGPDSDEGGAVVTINSYYLQDAGNEKDAAFGNAQIYGGVAGDDFADASEALKCYLAKK